jgi:glycosyltransferase involved in cell wall biosynthesis
MRYLWNMRADYLEQVPRLLRPWARRVLHRLRLWDFQTAQRVDRLVSDCRNVAGRVSTYWKRDSAVLYPPVELARFSPSGAPDEGYYLCLGELERYKRVDLAVAACTRLGVPLVVAGRGGEEKRLRRLAGPTVRFAGRVEDAEAVRLYQGCRALLFPGEEDFGLTPLEAQACGRPVIACGVGGALETVLDGKTGIFFDVQSVDALCGAIGRFEAGVPGISTAACTRNAARFSPDVFRKGLGRTVSGLLKRDGR